MLLLKPTPGTEPVREDFSALKRAFKAEILQVQKRHGATLRESPMIPCWTIGKGCTLPPLVRE